MGTPRLSRTLIPPVAVIAISTLVGFGLPLWLPWFGDLELAVFDARAKSALKVPVDPRIVVVGIADDTLRNLDARGGIVPRRYHAELISLLRDASASVVAFDLFFITPSEKKDDEALQAALNQNGNLGIVLAKEAQLETRDPSQVGGKRVYFAETIFRVSESPRAELAMVVPYNPDKICRGIFTVLSDWSTDPPAPLPHMTLSTYALAHGMTSSQYLLSTTRHTLHIGSKTWELGPDMELESRLLKDGEDFETWEYSDALKALRDTRHRESFRGKIVFVGKVNGDDEHLTPSGMQPGVVFNAQSLNSMISSANRPLRRLSDPLVIGISLLVSAIGTFAFWPPKAMRTIGLLVSASLLLWFVPAIILQNLLLWIPSISGLLSLCVAASLAGTIQAIRSDRFVPIFARRGRKQDAVEEVVIVFADIVGSTELLGQIGDQAGRRVFAKVLDVLTKAIHDAGGEVEKTQGDGVLAVFRKNDSPDYAIAALEGISMMNQAMKKLDADLFAEFGKHIALSFGMEEGEVSGRLTWAQGRQEWGLFGISIHLAARLQAECKNQATQLLIGPRLAEMLRQHVALVSMTPFQARGFTDEIQPYTISGLIDRDQHETDKHEH